MSSYDVRWGAIFNDRTSAHSRRVKIPPRSDSPTPPPPASTPRFRTWGTYQTIPRPQRITLRSHRFLPTTLNTHKRKWPRFNWHRCSPKNLSVLNAISALTCRDTSVRSADQTLRHTQNTHEERAQYPRRPARSPRATQLSVPPSRNRRSTILNTQQVPGDQPSAVAVATVIHCRDHALLERARGQGAPQPNSQRLFGDPTAAEFAYALRGGLVALVKKNSTRSMRLRVSSIPGFCP